MIVNIYLFSIFFSIDFAWWKKCGVTPHCLYRDSLTFKLSHFPNICKLALIKPLCKKAKTDPKAFRPILPLPIVSKTSF